MDRLCPSVSSSQGVTVDTEMEAGRSLQFREPLQTAPKKSRTRKVTTSDQSAVLRALLAEVMRLYQFRDFLERSDTVQSHFPTKAMREEVGRSIGLSARTVQVCSFLC